jgi:hypothetical protein
MDKAVTFTGPKEVNTFVIVVLRSAISLYSKTGMKANRAYTPTNMLRKAGEITGKTYKRGQLQIAYEDLGKKLMERAQ